jgi:hypothetical protein
VTRPLTPDLDPEAILCVLVDHGVRFIVIGGYAAGIHHVPVPPTTDIDITIARDDENLAALVEALVVLEAVNLVPEAVGSARPPFFDRPADILRRRFWSLVTPHGALDLVVAPDGFPGGFSELIGDAVEMPAVGPDGSALRVQVLVASVHHIYLSKKLAGRPKDVRALPALAQAMMRERRRRRDDR